MKDVNFLILFLIYSDILYVNCAKSHTNKHFLNIISPAFLIINQNKCFVLHVINGPLKFKHCFQKNTTTLVKLSSGLNFS